jgi:hypothetical protein
MVSVVGFFGRQYNILSAHGFTARLNHPTSFFKRSMEKDQVFIPNQFLISPD